MTSATSAAPTCHNDLIWGWRPHPGVGAVSPAPSAPTGTTIHHFCAPRLSVVAHTTPEHKAYHTCDYKQCHRQAARVGRQSYIDPPRLSTQAGSSEAPPVQLSGPTSSGHHQRVWHPLGDNLKPDPAVTQAARGSGQP